MRCLSAHAIIIITNNNVHLTFNAGIIYNLSIMKLLGVQTTRSIVFGQTGSVPCNNIASYFAQSLAEDISPFIIFK